MPNSVQTFGLLDDFVEQTYQNFGKELFENRCHLAKVIEEESGGTITPKGLRYPEKVSRPGGMGALSPTNRSHSPFVAEESGSRYIFPAGYTVPFVIDSDLLDSFDVGGRAGDDVHYTLASMLMSLDEMVAKKKNILYYGDRSGILALAASTHGATGDFTMTCSTTAGTATYDETRGGSVLWKNHYYAAINPSTFAIRGIFYIRTEGYSTVGITITLGTVSSGDFIVDGYSLAASSYNNYFNGLGGLISGSNRFFQGALTTNQPFRKSQEYDLANTAITPSQLSRIKMQIVVLTNDIGNRDGLLGAVTPGILQFLAEQPFGLRRYTSGEKAAQGQLTTYVEPGVKWIGPQNMGDADANADTIFLWPKEAVTRYTLRKYGWSKADGQMLRMRHGTNDTGSQEYFGAKHEKFNLGNKHEECCARIRRILMTNTVTKGTVLG